MGWYGTYLCADEKYVAVGSVESKFQKILSARAGGTSRVLLEKMFLTESQEYWVSFFSDACVSAVRTASEVFETPWIRSQKLFQHDHLRAPGGRFLPTSPCLGQHNHDILQDAGMTTDGIRLWTESGVLCG